MSARDNSYVKRGDVLQRPHGRPMCFLLSTRLILISDPCFALSECSPVSHPARVFLYNIQRPTSSETPCLSAKCSHRWVTCGGLLVEIGGGTDRVSQFLREAWALYSIGTIILLSRFGVRLKTVGWRGLQGDDLFSACVLVFYAMDAFTVHLICAFLFLSDRSYTRL